jgi:hypothetical protein
VAELSALSARLGLDAAAAQRALDAAAATGRPHVPVYIQALLGIGAWITAILMVAFLLLFLDFIVGVDLEEQTSVALAIGVASFAIAVALRRPAGHSAFRTQLASALSTAGVAIATAAVLVETESFWPAAAVAAVGTAAAIAEGRDRPTQFSAAALALALVFIGLGIDSVPYLTDIAALAGVTGVLLTLYPPRRDTAPLAAALLLALPCLMTVADSGVLAGIGGEGFAARLLNAGLTVWLLVRHRQLHGQPVADLTTAILIVAILVICAVLPPGGSAALVLMMLAFVLGLRGLGVIGVLFQIYFISRFYYDLQITLLEKSLILMAVGLLVLGAYGLVLRQQLRRALP